MGQQLLWFDAGLTIHFFSQSTGGWGSGLTRRISRRAVMFVPFGSAPVAGEALRYALAFPGRAGRAGAVASCCGRVVRADTEVVVTMDRCRLQTASAARARRDARTRRLAWLCDDMRPAARSNPSPPARALQTILR